MKVSHWLTAGVLTVAMATPGLSLAQDAGDDWDLVQDPSQNLTMAVLAFDGGQAVAVRCLAPTFEVILTGLPPRTGSTVALEIGFDDEDLRDIHWWTSEVPGLYVAVHPGLLARRLREGGDLNVVVAAEGEEARRRYVMSLVPSGAAIDATLAACGLPRDETRASGDSWVRPDSRDTLTWDSRPTPTFPDRAIGRSNWGHVFLSCVALPTGRVEQCQIDSERPENLGFGEAALASARRARVVPYTPTTDEEAAQGQILRFSVAFRLR